VPDCQENSRNIIRGHGLEWIDRITVGYLAFPIFLFFLWLEPLYAVGAFLLMVYGVFYTLQGPATGLGISRRWLMGLGLFACVWVALSGIGHFVYANTDWIIRDAVLHDLSVLAWPPTYADSAGIFILRAPVAYFLPAAAVGYAFGTSAADMALYLWTALGWLLVLVSACKLFDTPRQYVLCALILTFFGGMDVLGYLWRYGEPTLGEHIEGWGRGIQYSSNTTLLFWVPNHALPSWLVTAFIIRHWRHTTLARTAPLLLTVVPLWSPLAAIGLLPFFLLGLAWRRDSRLLFSLRTCLPFAPLALVMAQYLGMDASSVPHGWQMEVFPFMFFDVFALWYALFCMLEFGFLVLLLLGILRISWPLGIAVCVLFFLPFYHYGPNNDLAMRSSIPSLMVLSLASVKALLQSSHAFIRAALACVLIIGALGALQEPARALLEPRWQARNQYLPEAIRAENPRAKNIFAPHYFARVSSHGVQALLRKSTPMNASRLAERKGLAF